jgi:5-methylcytosine-specific restriction endonuclease McrA
MRYQPMTEASVAENAWRVSQPEQAGMGAMNNMDCQHVAAEIRRFTCANGAIQFVRQCLSCGVKRSNAIKTAPVDAEIGELALVRPFDESLNAAYWARRQAERDARRARESVEWGEWYQRYLQSQAWSERRRKVLERAAGLCEGCRDAVADEVHHLSYRHAGDEFLYELVALCRACHARAHAPAEPS